MPLVDCDALSGVLTSALASVGPIRGRTDSLGFVLAVDRLLESPDTNFAARPLLDLLAAIQKDPALKIFDGLMQAEPSGASRVEYRNAVLWLLFRAADVGATDAVLDLQRYVDASHLPCAVILAVCGIQPTEAADLGNGVRLLPWSEVDDCATKRSLNERFPRGLGLPTAAFVREDTLQKLHATHEQLPSPLPVPEVGSLRDAALCAALAVPTGVEPVASFVSLPPWVPVSGSGYAFSLDEPRAWGREFTGEHAHRSAVLIESWRSLPTQRQDWLRLATERFNRAMRRASLVDSSVDLGIALESIFLADMSDERTEMTYRLRVRGARFLGGDLNERQEIFRLLGQLYGLRSCAVHTGRVPDRSGPTPTSALLQRGYELASRAISNLILGPPPDWTQLTLAP